MGARALRCTVPTAQPSATTGVHTIDAGARDKAETIVKARIVSATGPVIAELGIVVLKRIEYKAEFFRVSDSASAGTALTVTGVTGAALTTGAVPYYKQAISTLNISGGAAELDIHYDSTAGKSSTNGSLDLEPGRTSAEERIIMARCVSSRSRAVQVHDLRWAYYFAANAAAGDTRIRIKNYGTTYLGYIGTQTYDIQDSTGQSESITVTAVNTSTGWLTLSSGLTNSYTTGDRALLIWPLGGLSGNPVWVGDQANAAALTNYVVHELGHQLAGWKDVCETNNFMHGGPSTGALLRHRPIQAYYNVSSTEHQWKNMTGR